MRDELVNKLTEVSVGWWEAHVAIENLKLQDEVSWKEEQHRKLNFHVFVNIFLRVSKRATQIVLGKNSSTAKKQKLNWITTHLWRDRKFVSLSFPCFKGNVVWPSISNRLRCVITKGIRAWIKSVQKTFSDESTEEKLFFLARESPL